MSLNDILSLSSSQTAQIFRQDTFWTNSVWVQDHRTGGDQGPQIMRFSLSFKRSSKSQKTDISENSGKSVDYYELMKNTFIKYSLICGDYAFSLKGRPETLVAVLLLYAGGRSRSVTSWKQARDYGQSVSVIDLLSAYQETPVGLSECVRVLDHKPLNFRSGHRTPGAAALTFTCL